MHPFLKRMLVVSFWLLTPFNRNLNRVGLKV